MTWKKARASDERDTVLICTSQNFRDIGKSLLELIGRMEADWLVRGFKKEDAIFIDINSSEGHVMVSWDVKGGGGAFSNDAWPTCYLELRHLWRAAEDHAEGAGHFDKQVHFAICCAVEDMLDAAEAAGAAPAYEVYELFEGCTNGAQRVTI
jgi:hypothetical protein